MKTILFQGDSITDCGRYRKATDSKQETLALFRDGKLFKKITALGDGYPAMVAAELESKYPGKYKYINRGVGGDRITDVYSRIVQDIINLKPDYMSLLVGVNDVWRAFDSGYGTGTARFEKIYDILACKSKTLAQKYNFFYKYIISHKIVVRIADLKVSNRDLAKNFPSLPQKSYKVILNMILSDIFEGKYNNDKTVILSEIEKKLKYY